MAVVTADALQLPLSRSESVVSLHSAPDYCFSTRMDDDTLPLLVAAVVSLFVYVLAAASLALDEEECVAHIAEVAQGIGIALVQNRWR